MRQRFMSSSIHKVDNKGRVSVPANFRRLIEREAEPAIYLISDFRGRGYLEAYAFEELSQIHADIEAMPRYSPAREILEEEFIAKAFEVSLDDTGRILLPRDIREENGITDTAVFVGVGKHFQIRSPENRAANKARIAAALGPDHDPFALLPGSAPAADPFEALS
jgi:MraZ protein